MKPLNHEERKNTLSQFAIIFSVTTIVLFIIGFLTLFTGKLGVDVLEKRHEVYTNSFRRKATLTFQIEEIIKLLNKKNDKTRSLSQHKKFQDLISIEIEKIDSSIQEAENLEEYIIFKKMITIIKAIQGDLDAYEEGYEKYSSLNDLLERCKEKYIKDQKNK